VLTRFEREAVEELKVIRFRLGCLVAIGVVGLILLFLTMSELNTGVRVYVGH
jgi:hypothetical protein